jgi:hypothetical protein
MGSVWRDGDAQARGRGNFLQAHDSYQGSSNSATRGRREAIDGTYLELGIGPSRNLNNHVQDGLLLVGIERNIMERRNGLAILLDVDSVLEGVGSRNLADGVVGGHVGLLL